MEKTNKKIKRCAGGIVYNENKEIFLMQSDYKWGDKWLVPGGKIEENETPEAAFKREMKEELGIEVENILKIGEKIKQPSKDFFDKCTEFHFFDFIAKSKTTKIIPNHELTNYIWIEPNKALKELSIVDSTENLIIKYLEIIEKNN